MGEIADMMLDGTLDYQTGEYLDGKSPGYPRTRYNDSNKSSSRGIKMFLNKKGLDKSKHNEFCFKYVQEHCNIDKLNKNNNNWEFLANKIQQNWKKFATYVHHNL